MGPEEERRDESVARQRAAAARAEQARERALELQQRRADLAVAVGEHSDDPDHLTRAKDAAQAALARAELAATRAAEAHRHAAEAHEEAARMADAIGDEDAARRHRTAAAVDLADAEDDDERAGPHED